MTTQTSGINTYSSIEGKLGEVLFFLASTGPIEKALIDFAIDSLKLYPGTELNTNNIAYTLSEVNLADNFGPIEYTHPIDLMCRQLAWLDISWNWSLKIWQKPSKTK